MSQPVHTVVERPEPWLYIELVGGRIEHLQFKKVSDADHDEFMAQLVSALSAALAVHHRERLDQVLAHYVPATHDEYRAEVLSFAADRLAAAADAKLLPTGVWFPERADGRDPSGQVHASVTSNRVLLVEVPLGMLADPQRTGWAIRDAVNQALERLADDVVEYASRRQPVSRDDASELDWRAMTEQVRRYRQGYS